MAENPKLPRSLILEVVTPEGLLLREEVDEVIAPGELGYFGVLPGHTPFLSTLGLGEITYRRGADKHHLTCFWGFCEVLPDRVNVLAEIGERAEDIDPGRAEEAKARAAEKMKAIKDEAGYKEAHLAYTRAVTRLAVARKRR
jgi:F-type H+-transporting ATPase subunit epsilon